MTSWWWVRHGPTHAKAFTGVTDLPADLSDTAALQRLEHHLPDDSLVVSSDLIRAMTTADAIQADRPRLPNNTEIREMNFGEWEARTFAEVNASHPELSRKFWTEPGDIAPPNGESWNMTAQRVGAEVDRMNSIYPDQNIIAVAHLGVILTQLQRAADVPPASAMSFKIDNLSVTQLEFSGGKWQVHSINHKP